MSIVSAQPLGLPAQPRGNRGRMPIDHDQIFLSRSASRATPRRASGSALSRRAEIREEAKVEDLAVRGRYTLRMQFVLDNQGLLRQPNLHDGFVDGIYLKSDKAVQIMLRDLRDHRFLMELSGVEALTCNEFKQGNIISVIWIVRGMPPSADTLALLFEPPHPAVDQKYRDQHKSFIEQQVGRIKDGVVTLVSIEPSYGCELVALAERVEIATP
jgi:hypothetical protein